MSLASRVLSVAVVVAWSSSGIAADGDWQSGVAAALGKPGSDMPGGVYRVALPRTDLKATLDGVSLQPGFALGGWVAFERMGGAAMVMGDLVVTEGEANRVMAQLLAGGIEVTALHNHLLRNRPFTMYMHVLGHGDPTRLAATLHRALAVSGTPLAPAAPGSSPATAPPPVQLDLDMSAINAALGAKGANNSGVLQYSIPRADAITDGAVTIPPAMGVANAINFQPTGGGKAAITGDFVLIAKEVNPVLKTMREHGIGVTAIHNHMLGERPRLFFVHFWANDDAQKLARALKAVLAEINIAKG